MLIQDLRFIEETDGTDHIHGGASAYTEVTVDASGSKAYARVNAKAYGIRTSATTLSSAISAKGGSFTLSGATGGATASGITVDGGSPQIATSLSADLDTDFITF